MASLSLPQNVWRSRIAGAWQAKQIGIALGSAAQGKSIASALQFYAGPPVMPENCFMLELPLHYLAALQSAGLDFTGRALLQAWQHPALLQNVRYAQPAANLQAGMAPPASGYWAGFFREEAEAAARADLWAMLLPCVPEKAAAAAFYDSIQDRAGEGVWAAMFSAAVLSASLFVQDPKALFAIGLAMIPRSCAVTRAVKAALAAAYYAEDWQKARERVLQEAPGKNPCHAASAAGFFAIGLLYGAGNFGPTLCIGVNCGGASTAVGALLGAAVGLMQGQEAIPAEWSQPLLQTPLAVLEGAPYTLQQAVQSTCELALQSIGAHGLPLSLPGEQPLSTPLTSQTQPDASAQPSSDQIPAAPQVPDETAAVPVNDILSALPWAQNSQAAALHSIPPQAQLIFCGACTVQAEMAEAFATVPQQKHTLRIVLHNAQPDALAFQAALQTPPDWAATGTGLQQTVPPGANANFSFVVHTPQPAASELFDRLALHISTQSDPNLLNAAFILPRSACWWTAGPFANHDGEGYDTVYAPEMRFGLQETYAGRFGQIVRWQRMAFAEPELALEPLFMGSGGVCYGQAVLLARSTSRVRITAAANCGVKLWLNGALILRRHSREEFSAALQSGSWAVEAQLLPGENRLLAKWIRGNEPYRFALLASDLTGGILPAVCCTTWE